MRRIISADEWEPRGIEELEPNAEEVVRSAQNVLVTAGPGAGKTELLAQRASFVLETGACAYPRRILAISFKRDAAKNLRTRVHNRSGQDLGRRLDSYTFDAFAKGILDQFRAALPADLRPSLDYEILFSLKREEVEEILLSLEPPHNLGGTDDLREFATEQFFSKDVPRARLRTSPDTLHAWAAREFWRVLLHEAAASRLSFPMIGRLAGHLLKTDARLARAYRASYSHVFLDEFQDTTALQYWLTRLLFQGTPAVLTAVGDPRQQIMGWAGALPDIFAKFERDFTARTTQLHRNHRASVEIAPVVCYLADQLGTALGKDGTEVEKLVSQIGPPAEACAAHIFPDEDDEAEWIAEEIDDLLGSGVAPRDIGVLVRMRTQEYGARVKAALVEKGRSARVEDQMQDLLTEPIIEACLLALRALACEIPGGTWAEFRELVAEYRGIAIDDKGRRVALERELSEARNNLRAACPYPPDDTEAVAAMLATAVEPVVEPLRRRHGQYRRGSFYGRILQQLAEAIAAAANVHGIWSAVLDEVEGRTAVPILTIHKSKGLEYHAVFFVGLEDGAFWNFKRNPDEESNAFFVALSRAKARVVFSFARIRTRRGRSERQTSEGIKKLYDLMEAAGVATIRHGAP